MLDAVGDPWFRCGQIEPDKQQEDIDFSIRATAAGYQPALCGDVRLIHEIRGWVTLGADGRVWVRPKATWDVMYPLNIKREAKT